MTVNEILQKIDSLYPNAESASLKVRFMNDCINSMSVEYGTIVEDSTVTTVADDDSYSFPSGLTDVSEIIQLSIGNSATPDNRFDYTEYKYAPLFPTKTNGVNSYYQIVSSTGAKSLGIYPEPDTTGLPIRIKYRKRIPELSASSLGDSPEFDSRFHHILVYYVLGEITSMGASPDTVQSNMFRDRYDEEMIKLRRYQYKNSVYAPLRFKDNPQWHR